MVYISIQGIINELRTQKITKLFLDYDGTLVPLVSSPELAKADEELKNLLNKLKKIMPLYIITGRDLNDLLSLLGTGFNIIAMHGAQFMDENGNIKNIDNFDYYVKRSSFLTAKYSYISKDFPGVRVYDKKGGVQFHYFNLDRNLISKFRAFMEGLEEEDFELYSGKYVYEFRIKGINKGIAIVSRISGTDHIIFAGDDNTDEEAFKMLKEHITIKVGEGDTVANHRLDSYLELRYILKYITEKHEEIV